ncbi:MAG: glyoxalase [Prevotellaceae bacterium]|jgi:hypothetical protein|nr:glyoxalase [Prevotellaceae bacterium]
MNTLEKEIGKPVELHTPEKGYIHGNICGYSDYKYAIELTSGYIVYRYCDEFTILER